MGFGSSIGVFVIGQTEKVTVPLERDNIPRLYCPSLTRHLNEGKANLDYM